MCSFAALLVRRVAGEFSLVRVAVHHSGAISAPGKRSQRIKLRASQNAARRNATRWSANQVRRSGARRKIERRQQQQATQTHVQSRSKVPGSLPFLHSPFGTPTSQRKASFHFGGTIPAPYPSQAYAGRTIKNEAMDSITFALSN